MLFLRKPQPLACRPFERERPLQQMAGIQDALGRIPSADAMQLQLELDEVLSVIPAVRSKYPGQ